jgi:hypothetical protein
MSLVAEERDAENVRPAPAPIRAGRRRRPPPRRIGRDARDDPATTSHRGAMTRVRPERWAGPTPARIAAIGGTRVARSAGATLARRSRRCRRQRDDTCAAGHGVARRQSRPRREDATMPGPRADLRPAPQRGGVASSSASSRTSAAPDRREAPRVRSSASSDRRWAIVIENVFEITNAPDEHGDAAEDQERSAQEPELLLLVVDLLVGVLLAGEDVGALAAQRSRTRSRSCSATSRARARRSRRSFRPCRWPPRRRGRVRTTTVAPAGEPPSRTWRCRPGGRAARPVAEHADGLAVS